MKKKWLNRLTIFWGVLIMIGAVGSGLENVSYAAEDGQNISGNPISDNTSARKITIWKYKINSSTELGERGDGLNNDLSKAPDLENKKIMDGVNFEIIKVNSIGNASLVNPLKQVEGKDWEENANFEPMKDKTKNGGKVTFDVGTGKVADGIYLVREIKDSISGDYTYTDENGEKKKINKPMDPFFVHLPQTKRDDTGELIYDVHVYPKNIVTDTKLDKTIEGGKGYSIKAGNSFQWEATTKLPDGLYNKIEKEMTITNWLDPEDGLNKDLVIDSSKLPFELFANYFKVKDSLDERLLLQDVEAYVLNEKQGNPIKLINGTEYEVTVGGTKIIDPNKIEDLTEGSKKDVEVSLTNGGMKKVTLDKYTYLQIVYKVTTNKDFNGAIVNKYDVNYLLPGQDPVTETSKDNPVYYDGGFDIKKKDEGSEVLAGAEFHIATSLENADSKTYLASDGKSYKLNNDLSTTPELPKDINFITATSDKNGKAEFNGLALNWFTDTDGDGKQDLSNPAEATWDKDKIEKKYWVVETKAPFGYELIKDSKEVTVTLGSAEDTNIELTIINKKKTELPFTGGTGTMLIIIIAIGAIAIGTAAITIDKKRRTG